MKDVWRFVPLGLAFYVLSSGTGQLSAQTTLLNTASPSAFTFGNQKFTITGCTFNGAACTNSSNAEIVDQFSGRNGTEIVVKGVSGGSAIYSGSSNYALNFNLAVAPLAGTAGISKITDLLTGSDTNSAGHTDSSGNSHVFAAVTGNSPTAFAQIRSTIGANAQPQSFTLQRFPSSANFSINVGVNALTGQTLTLTSAALLFNPAPEPASIMLFATGLTGLIAVRRRCVRRHKPTSNPAA